MFGLLYKCLFLLKRYPPNTRETFYICPEIDQCLKHLYENEYLAVGVSRYHAQNNPHISRRKIFCLDRTQNILSYPVQLFMRKDYPFASEINKVIRRAVEGGLFTKWMRDTVVQRKGDLQELPVKPLQLEHISAAILAYILFTTFAYGAFVAEYTVHKRVHQKTTNHRFWKIADYLLDGDRHEFLFVLFWKWIRFENMSSEDFNALTTNSP